MFFTRARAARRSAASPAFAAGLAALRRRRYAEAVEAFARAAAETADARARAAAHNKRGVAEIARGDRVAGRDAFAAALAVDARYAPAFANLGNLLVEERAWLDAIDYYRAALEIDPQLPGAHRGLGIAFRALGRPGAAVRAFRAADRHAFRPRPDA